VSELSTDNAAIDERITELHDKHRYLFEWHVFFAEERPEWLHAYEQLYAGSRPESRLPQRYRECVYTAVLSALGEEALIKNHIHKAFEAGATRDDIIDAILVAWTPSGARTLCHGIKALVEVLIERGEYEYRDVPFRVTDRPEHSARTYTEDNAPAGSARPASAQEA
jgi:alkylhydroperoxidase/carboxymuconolactone decarboxylase family protein YurZ